MSHANLKIIFLDLNKKAGIFFNIFELNNNSFKTNKNIDIKVPFDEKDIEIGKKICKYSLIMRYNKVTKTKVSGIIEIYLGNNIGYCFIDNIGVTFDLCFFNNNGSIDKFVISNFLLNHKNFMISESISVKPNKNNTQDRANILLINCWENLIIKINGESIIEFSDIIKEINNYSFDNSYQVCFSDNNFRDFATRKIEEINTFNFKNIFDKYKANVNQIYEQILYLFNNHKNLEKKLQKICDDNQYLEDEILFLKFVYPKKVLGIQFNNELYIDFFFKLIYFLNIKKAKEKKETINTTFLQEMHDRLLKEKNKICNDKNLKIYEKIFLLIEIFFSELFFKEKKELLYFHSSQNEKNSPLDYAYKFLKKFIDELNYKSNFYYPLLCIDSGIFNCQAGNSSKKNITTYGFNMYPLSTIKKHLENMIPDIIVLSDNMDKDENANTNSLTGVVTLNNLFFKDIEIHKTQKDNNISRHYGFRIAKKLFHELFGHKKSAFGKEELNYKSPISFKNKVGELKFIDENNNEKQYCDINQIIDNLDVEKINGDSGYFLEYFFGKIDDEYTTRIIDQIEDKTYLGVLLDSNLWHKNIKTLKHFVELKYYIVNYYKGKELIDENSGIEKQIEKMKEMLAEESSEEECSKSANSKDIIENKGDSSSSYEDEKLGKIMKKYRAIKFNKGNKQCEDKLVEGNNNDISKTNCKITKSGKDPYFFKRIYRK